MRWWCAVMLACVASGVAGGEAGKLAAADNPASGVVANGAYSNAYFGLRYALPEGWVEGEEGPAVTAFPGGALANPVSHQRLCYRFLEETLQHSA